MSQPLAAQSRRAIVAGSAAAAGAWLLSALVRTPSVRAADGGNALIDLLNSGTANTAFQNSDASEIALEGDAGTGGKGVRGYASGGIGVLGESDTGKGVSGHSGTGPGVYGDSSSGFAVYGQSGTTWIQGEGFTGAVGWSKSNGPGIGGYSNDGSGSVLPFAGKCGVHGYANQDSSAVRVAWHVFG